MFLKEIETKPVGGMTKIAFKKLRDAGEAIPEILHLFRFNRRSTDHLVRFTEEVMRGPSPLSPGMRELIGAYFSRRNQCCFCSDAHAAAAAQFLEKELVEEVLLDIPAVKDAAVIGTPHRIWGEAVTAVLVPAGAERDSPAVLDACRARLAGYRMPKRVEWVESLPRNAYGKVLKQQLREQFSVDN